MSTTNDTLTKLFEKCLGLITQRTGLRIRNAVMLIDTEQGDFQVVLKDKPQILLLINKFYTRQLLGLIMKRYGSQLIPCDRCNGEGEYMSPGEVTVLSLCPKCKGGGQMVVSFDVDKIGENDDTNRKQSKW